MIKILVKADVARFGQQAEKVDCSTYPIPTPSSLIGLLGAIHGKPEFNWEIRTIKVLNEITIEKMWTVGSKGGSKKALVGGSYLRDVAYVVEAEAVIPPYEDNIIAWRKGINLQKKHEETLKRRVRQGRVGNMSGRLYLGRHECHCSVELIEGEEPKSFYEGTGTRTFHSIPYVQSFEVVHNICEKGRGKDNKIFRSPFKKNNKYFISNFHYTDLVMKDGLITIDGELYKKHTTNNSY